LSCPSDEELRSRSSIKWSRTVPGVIAADIAELDFLTAPAVSAALSEAAARSDFGYPDFSAGLSVRVAERFAWRMQERFGWSPTPGRIQLCAQIMQGLSCAVLAYTKPGDWILTHAPTYAPIVHILTQLGRRPLFCPPCSLRDVSDLHEAMDDAWDGKPIPMVILCNPHNPTGRVLDERTLEVFAEFSAAQRGVVFCDEIYQDLVHWPARHCSAGSVPALHERAVIFTSAAKSFSIGGLRCAVGYFGSRELYETYCQLPWHLRNGASLPGMHATVVAWDSGGEWLAALRAQLVRNRAILGSYLDRETALQWQVPDATYLAWLSVRRPTGGGDLPGFLLLKAKVALQAGQSFGPGFAGYARLNFGTSEKRLHEIIRRLEQALSGPPA